MASNLQNGFYKFCIGLFCLWVVMAFGLASIAAKDLLVMVGRRFCRHHVPPADLLALTYQFNVLPCQPAPVCLWIWQLGSPLWEALASDKACFCTG